IERGEGAVVWDDEGRRYLDSTAGLWYCNVGYGREEIVEAAAQQMRKLHAYSNFGDYTTRATNELAERVASIAPTAGSVVFFASNGSDAVDSAAKLVHAYWREVGQPRRTTVIVREHAYHGMHLGGTGFAGIEANRAGYEGMVTGVVRVAWDSPEALAEAIDSAGKETVGAFFCEPVIGAGGVRPAPDGYLAAVRQICRERGVLYVSDEVITGFGRTGAWFASNRFDLEPDLLLCAKGITSGYLPMGAVLASPAVAEPFWHADHPVMWRHGYTYSGHATVAAAALANLAIIEREGLIERALELEVSLADALAPLAKHPLVSEVRSGVGVLAAVQIDPAAQAADAALTGRVLTELRRAGVLGRLLAGGALQISPALVISDEQVDELAGALTTALDACS
ncbi:MAG TPA: aminotransferase class III-fold pyridoxal phosphate-dependent enzyme, partial [Acidimicrobiales bacterium]|nr:aminotransferase class III-fold pyridoxal phosphate-dependent enzyme [Acidimicrobiales bacterium]